MNPLTLTWGIWAFSWDNGSWIWQKWPYMDKTALFSVPVCNSEADPDRGAGGAPHLAKKEKGRWSSVVENESSIFADDTTMFTLVKTWPTPVEVWLWIWTPRPIGQKFGECCTMLKKAITWPSGVSMFVFRPWLFRWVVWQYHKLTITSTSASILSKASRGQTTSTKFFHRVLGESACYDACEGYYQTLLFEEFTLALFDPSSRVLSVVEIRSQSWWSCKNHSAAAIMLRFRLWKNDFFFRSLMLLEVPLKLGLKQIQILSNPSPNRVIETITEHPRIPLDT